MLPQRNSSAAVLHSEQVGTWHICPILSFNAVENIVVGHAIGPTHRPTPQHDRNLASHYSQDGFAHEQYGVAVE